jgi:hypothetical protein
MASPHVPADLFQPAGLLTPGLFPNLSSADQATFIQGFLDAGYAEAANISDPTAPRQDAFALAWAYSQAYQAVWQRLNLTPATLSVDGQASQTFLGQQITAFDTLARKYQAECDSFFAADDGATGGTQVVTGVDTTFTW